MAPKNLHAILKLAVKMSEQLILDVDLYLGFNGTNHIDLRRSRVLQYRDAKGVILLDILPQSQCISAARYCSTLDRLKEAIRRKRPGLLRKGVVLQHDNATPHSANLTQQWLQRYGWEILPHPAHSPDLAPSDFHLFGPLKRHLGGMAFETEDDLISELRNWFDNLDVDFFRVGINSLLSRWQKCIDLHGDYVEKPLGELGSIVTGGDSKANVHITNALIPLSGKNSVIGRGLAVHEKKDDSGQRGDKKSLKSGNAVPRLACVVIGRSKSTK
ncbi:superoxide dismutase [Cu-Zn] [Plakobranchus ocellatus]|uniref:Superoxide dismutase [Cu-Zn] n=1 Tax=Plakobranchus ocellatus TaxID=259542 RepID=A0AAV3ZEW1_9GAST|nr:superoxide dismutase [Cu-Zn] [Plakobranchus ocellatus]